MGHLWNKGTLLANDKLTAHWDSPVLLCRAAFPSVGPQPTDPRCLGLSLLKYRTLHSLLPNFMRLLSARFSSLPKSFWIAALPSSILSASPNLVLSTNLLRMHSIPLLRLLMKTIDDRDPNADHWKDSYSSPAGLCTSDYNSLSPAVQLVLHINHLSSSYVTNLVMRPLRTVTKVLLKRGHTMWIQGAYRSYMFLWQVFSCHKSMYLLWLSYIHIWILVHYCIQRTALKKCFKENSFA